MGLWGGAGTLLGWRRREQAVVLWTGSIRWTVDRTLVRAKAALSVIVGPLFLGLSRNSLLIRWIVDPPLYAYDSLHSAGFSGSVEVELGPISRYILSVRIIFVVHTCTFKPILALNP